MNEEIRAEFLALEKRYTQRFVDIAGEMNKMSERVEATQARLDKAIDLLKASEDRHDR